MHTENLSQALQVMLFGMAGVFMVLLIIAGLVKLLAKLFPEKKENK